MDVLVPNSMKDAANCDKQCELQKSVNHQTSERIRHSWDPFSECVWLSVSIFLIIYLVLTSCFHDHHVMAPSSKNFSRCLFSAIGLSSIEHSVIASAHFWMLNDLFDMTWAQARQPAEFKHIIKRRERN